jgi:hypothetical protein
MGFTTAECEGSLPGTQHPLGFQQGNVRGSCLMHNDCMGFMTRKCECLMRDTRKTACSFQQKVRGTRVTPRNHSPQFYENCNEICIKPRDVITGSHLQDFIRLAAQAVEGKESVARSSHRTDEKACSYSACAGMGENQTKGRPTPQLSRSDVIFPPYLCGDLQFASQQHLPGCMWRQSAV